jgi:hypothetical protein
MIIYGELGGLREEICPISRYYHAICLEELTEILQNLRAVCASANIQTGNLPYV